MVRLSDWYGTPERMVNPPVVEELHTQEGLFSSPAQAKCRGRLRSRSKRLVRHGRVFRVEDLRERSEPLFAEVPRARLS